jgi:peptide chain release factor 1
MIDGDFNIRVTKGTGPGGQNRNKVETCVIVTHIPTGITEKCQDSRSQWQNKILAKERVMERVNALKEQKKHERQNEIRKKLIQNPIIIRTYSFVRNEVVDHRTKKHYDLSKFIEGKISFPTNIDLK